MKAILCVILIFYERHGREKLLLFSFGRLQAAIAVSKYGRKEYGICK